MRRLYYSSGSLLTGDHIAKAVMRYARALADTQTSDVVSIPVLVDGGRIAYAHMLLGPASQLFSTPISEAASEPEDVDLLEELEQRTRRLQPATPPWPDEMPDVTEFDMDSI